MKKILLFFTLIALTSLSYAAMQAYQAVITDCGTIHQIASNATIDEACDALESWSTIDCS